MRIQQLLIVTFTLGLALVLAACQPVLLDPSMVESDSSALMVGNPEPTVISAAKVHLFPVDGNNSVAGAASTLARTPNGVTLTIDTLGLTPGDVYTIWWVVFNQPTACSDGQCMAPDLSDPATMAMVSYATGEIADKTGQASFSATLDVGDIATALDNESGFPFELVEPAPGLIEPMSADIHAVIRSHGAALDDPEEQLTSFNGGCNPECFNVQATVHAPFETLARDDAPLTFKTSSAEMHQFPVDATNVVEGTLSILQRTPEGVTIEVKTVGLEPGHAYTLWLAVFNYPDECSDRGCVPQDMIQMKIASMVKYATGAIAKADGTATFRSSLPIGDVEGALDNGSGFPFELVEPAPGLLEPLGAEIHAIIRSHGAALDDPSEQLASFNGGCNPECFNVQAVMHIP